MHLVVLFSVLLIFVVKVQCWQPTTGVDPNRYLTLCLYIIRDIRWHKMILNTFGPMYIRLTPLHLFGLDISPLQHGTEED